jgi:hypothetical protein
MFFKNISIGDTVLFTSRKGFSVRKVEAIVNDISGHILAVSTKEGEPFLINKFDVEGVNKNLQEEEEDSDIEHIGTSDRLINESNLVITIHSDREVTDEEPEFKIIKKRKGTNKFYSLDIPVIGNNLDIRV